MCTDHVDTTSSLSTTINLMSILFSPIFWLYLHQLPYTLSQRVYIMSIFFLLIFPVLAIFAWITILQNAHRPCKQYINIVDSSLCHSILFWSFPGVLGIFTSITILGDVHRPCKQFPNLVNTCLHHASSFLPDFLIIFVLITIFGKCAQTM